MPCGNWAYTAVKAYAKCIQHAAVQTVMHFARWMRGWGRLIMSYQHHHCIGVECALAECQHLKNMVGQNPCCSTWGITRELGVRTSHFPFKLPGWRPVSIQLLIGSRVQTLWLSSLFQILCLSWEYRCDLGSLEHILWSEKAAFIHEGVFNSHNSHLWA